MLETPWPSKMVPPEERNLCFMISRSLAGLQGLFQIIRNHCQSNIEWKRTVTSGSIIHNLPCDNRKLLEKICIFLFFQQICVPKPGRLQTLHIHGSKQVPDWVTISQLENMKQKGWLRKVDSLNRLYQVIMLIWLQIIMIHMWFISFTPRNTKTYQVEFIFWRI